MTIRLSTEKRDKLNSYVNKIVTCPVEKEALDAAYARAAPLVRYAVLDKYPLKDMKILAEYEAAWVDNCIKLVLTAGGVEEFQFRDDTGPLVAKKTTKGQIYQAGPEATDAVADWVLASRAYHIAMKRKRDDYHSLIAASTTFEQVVAIWPEAEALAGELRGTSLIMLSDEVIARIQADVKSRAEGKKS